MSVGVPQGYRGREMSVGAATGIQRSEVEFGCCYRDKEVRSRVHGDDSSDNMANHVNIHWT